MAGAALAGQAILPGLATGACAKVSGESGPANLDPLNQLWYPAPAREWTDALPLGNGRVGAMPTGGIPKERIWLNEDTLCAEFPGSRDVQLDISPHFDEVVALLDNGKYVEAEAIVTRNWLGGSQPCYQPFGTLDLAFADNTPVSSYVRKLDLVTGIHSVRYVQSGVEIEREMFVSVPGDAIVYRIKADKPGALSLGAAFSSPHPGSLSHCDEHNELVFRGRLPVIALRRSLETVEKWGDTWKYPEIWNANGIRKPGATQFIYDDLRGMMFEGRLRVLATDGKVFATEQGLAIRDAGEVTLTVALASSFNGFDRDPAREGINPATRTKVVTDRIARLSYAKIRDDHVTDHRRLYDRVKLAVPLGQDGGAKARLPTDQRRASYIGRTDDPSLPALLFNYGRYLLMASSRPGTQAANLQGIWNIDRLPPWASGYTTNINVQMNYWGAEVANLAECHTPLFDLIREVSVTGRKVARDFYHRDGWVVHHNTTLWRGAQPVDLVGSTSFWPTAGGWLCQHLWTHFLFSGDKAFLQQAYPLMRGAAEFYDDWLTDDGSGHLQTPVACSPENFFIYNENGKRRRGGMTPGCLLDHAVIRELFANTAAAAAVLGVDAPFAEHLRERRERIRPYAIGGRGQLLEYHEEFEDYLPRRHDTSPYYPLFPGNEFTRRTTPEWAAAERVLLVERAKKNVGGWQAAWLGCAWSRLGDASESWKYLQAICAETFPNFLNAIGGVFQVDGNLGGMALVAEMLVQSHAGEIELLPALPAIWKEGSITGLRARGGYVVDLAWSNNMLSSARVTSRHGGTMRIRCGTRTAEVTFEKGQTLDVAQELNMPTV